MSVIERLAERVARQEEKVAKETEKLETYRSQLQTAMYQAFIKRQQNSPWTFDEALTQAFTKMNKNQYHQIIEMRNNI
ncbi:DUF5965 family protein [Streptococcus agalactiae]|nr:DUF5965 family protein [Streptococcus agalactiae]